MHPSKWNESQQARVRELIAEDEHGCWIWKNRVHKTTGYGRIRSRNKDMLAHRFSYEVFVGPIPAGLELDHLCRVRNCVNPEHLEPVTTGENSRRSALNFVGRNVLKTHCPQGHPYDEVNTRITLTGGRECKECRRETTRRYRARQAFRAAGIELSA